MPKSSTERKIERIFPPLAAAQCDPQVVAIFEQIAARVRMGDVVRAMVHVPPGRGKSRVSQAMPPPGVALFLVQDHALGDEVISPDLRWRGRHFEVDGVPMCLVADEATAAARSGVNVEEAICPQCPFRDECGYMQQARERDEIAARGFGTIVATHDALEIGLKIRFDTVILDEAPRQGFVSVEAFTVEDLAFPDDPAIHAALTAITGNLLDLTRVSIDLVRSALKAIDDGPARRGKPLSQQLWGATGGAEGGHREGLSGRLRRVLDREGPRSGRRFRPLLEALLIDLECGHPTGVWFSGGKLRVSRVREPFWDDKTNFLYLDATLDPVIAERVFGPMEYIAHEVPLNAVLIQMTGATGSKQSITGDRGKARRDDLLALHEVVSKLWPTLTVIHKDAREALGKGSDPNWAHWGAVTGRNDWRDCTAVIIASRPMASTLDIEAEARGFAAGGPFDALEHNSHRDDRRERISVTAKDGTTHSIFVDDHPDPWGKRVVRRYLQDMVLQAIARIRPYNDTTKVVILACDVPPPVQPDLLLPFTEVANAIRPGGPVRSFAERFGLLPLGRYELIKHGIADWAARGVAGLADAVTGLMLRRSALALWLLGGSSTGNTFRRDRYKYLTADPPISVTGQFLTVLQDAQAKERLVLDLGGDHAALGYAHPLAGAELAAQHQLNAGGIVYTSSAHASLAYPDLYPSKMAAQRAGVAEIEQPPGTVAISYSVPRCAGRFIAYARPGAELSPSIKAKDVHTNAERRSVEPDVVADIAAAATEDPAVAMEGPTGPIVSLHRLMREWSARKRFRDGIDPKATRFRSAPRRDQSQSGTSPRAGPVSQRDRSAIP